MKEPETIQAKFTASSKIIKELTKYSLNNSEFKIIPTKGLDDPYSFEFDLTDAATIMTLIAGGLYLGELVKYLFIKLKENKDEKILIQTSIATVEIKFKETLTEEELRKKLQILIQAL